MNSLLVCLAQQTEIISLRRIKRLICTQDTESVYSVLRNKPLNRNHIKFNFQRVNQTVSVATLNNITDRQKLCEKLFTMDRYS